MEQQRVHPAATEQNIQTGNSDEVSAAEVQLQLERLVRSEGFSRTERPGRFLAFLVTYALRGEARKLTEYVLALEVFNRKDSFDPSSDPIVRVEAGRLRRRLAEYYETDGREDPIVIAIPPRTYVPVFRRRAADPPETAPAPVEERRHPRRTWWWAGAAMALLVAAGGWTWSRSAGASASELARASGRPVQNPVAIAVLPFTDLSPAGGEEQFCDALTLAITGAVARIGELRVISHAWVMRYKGSKQDVRAIAAELNAGLVLEGAVQRIGNRVRVTAELTNASNGYHVWSQTYDREIRDLFDVQYDLAHAVVDAVRPEISRLR